MVVLIGGSGTLIIVLVGGSDIPIVISSFLVLVLNIPASLVSVVKRGSSPLVSVSPSLSMISHL